MKTMRRRGRTLLVAFVAIVMLPVAAAAETAVGGESQSPIDIRREDVTFVDELPDIRFGYAKESLDLLNTGSPDPEATVRALVNSPANLHVKDETYRLLQFHFHTPSEHRLDGEAFPMEMHLVHQADDGEQLVVGVLIEAGHRHRELSRIFRDLPADETETRAIDRFDLDELIPDDDATYRYEGSLTTPPFTEGVQWIVFDEPLELSSRQIAAFQALFPAGNAREPQPLNDRPILSDVERGSPS
jgi:carbonic anhydrase